MTAYTKYKIWYRHKKRKTKSLICTYTTMLGSTCNIVAPFQPCSLWNSPKDRPCIRRTNLLKVEKMILLKVKITLSK